MSELIPLSEITEEDAITAYELAFALTKSDTPPPFQGCFPYYYNAETLTLERDTNLFNISSSCGYELTISKYSINAINKHGYSVVRHKAIIFLVEKRYDLGELSELFNKSQV